MPNTKGITLIGMPGSGKSTIGEILAENLGWRFIDLDILIKERTGRSHVEILAEIGDIKFIELEGRLASEQDLRNTVFSPGGSLVYSGMLMEKIRESSRIVYLFLPVSEIKKRLGGAADSRGIVGLKEKGMDGLFSERDVLYRSYADEVLDCEGLDKNDIVELLADRI